MGVISNIRRLLDPRVEIVRYSGRQMMPNIEGMSVEKLYFTQANLHTVIDFLARNIAELPLKVYKKESDGSRERDTTSVIAKLLESPNPHQTTYELIRDLVCDLKLYDYAVWIVGRDPESSSGWQIRHVPYSWITEFGGGNGWAYEWLEFTDKVNYGRKVRVDMENCIVFHGYTPGDPREGSSAIRSLKSTLSEQISAQMYRRDVWERGMQIPGYISRPVTVEPWQEQSRNRFIEQLKSAWSKGGERRGGTPVLEDGMKYEPVQFDAKEKDWASGVQLSREEVAAAFFVNPAIIWHTQNQTYASARDNARSFYSDTLMPDLTFIAKRINRFLLPMIGASKKLYVEFDINAKLQGNFEEQISALVAATGAPIFTVAEAREKMNLKRIPDTDDIIVPMNVTQGGQANSTDTDTTDPTVTGYGNQRLSTVDSLDDSTVQHKSDDPDREPRARHVVRSWTEDDEEIKEFAKKLRDFWFRQSKTVLSQIGAKARKAAGDDDPDWWDQERWDRELAEDIGPDSYDYAYNAAIAALNDLGIDLDEIDEDDLRQRVDGLVQRRARMLNASMLRDLVEAMDDESGKTPQDVFTEAYDEPAKSERNAKTMLTAVGCFAAVHSVGKTRAAQDGNAVKIWHHGQNPRMTHAAMEGDVAPIRGFFSNGAQWPGDTEHLDVAEVANCNCYVELLIW